MSTAYDRWLASPYAETDEAREELDRACEEVSEDDIYAELDDDALACGHEWLSHSAHLVGKLLKMPTIRIGMSAVDLAALEVLSRVADCAFTERQMAIETCAKRAIAS